MKKLQLTTLLLSLGICFLAAAIGSLFTFQSIPTWYAALNKPVFNPPNWLFGPVWTILYTMMGISLYIIWIKKIPKNKKKSALTYFFLQLILNALWSIIFFGLHSPLFGFLTIIILWMAIYQTIKRFIPLSKIAGQLLIPYLMWVTFASVLNFSIVILNK